MELPVTRVAVRKTTMASETDTDVQCVGKNIPRTKRKLQKHLRSAGLAYVSRTGKIIPAKKVADELCQCPQKCNERVSQTHRERLFTYFYHTLGDADSQNKFLRAHMDVRARLPPSRSQTPTLPGTRPPRRITCKYLIPLLPKTILIEDDVTETLEICQKAFCSSFVISTKRVRLQREKLIHSLGLNSYHHQRHLKKRNNHNNETVEPILVVHYDEHSDVPQIEINTVREQKIEEMMKDEVLYEMTTSTSNRKCLVDNPLIPLGISVPDGVTIAPVTATPDHDRDIAIVNNFFSNQLWKPEYIGAYS